MKKTMVCALAALAASGVLTTALSADAADCGTYPNPVYVAGSTASKPIWAALASKLTGISIIYQAPSSCVGLNDVATAVADSKPAIFEDGSSAGVACTNPGPVNIGISDVFPTSCANFTVPAGFKDFQGPIQSMVIAVPYASTEYSISSDAAYTVFGWGGTSYPVAPWTNYQEIFIRASTSGNQTLIGSAIGLASTKWLSQAPDGGASQALGSATLDLQALQGAGAGANASEAIGIMSSDLGDSFRGPAGVSDAGAVTGGIRVLAFQAADQKCGYLPDSDATHFEKINVRQGRYDIWGPIHLLTAVDGSGNPTNAQAATLIKNLTFNGLTNAEAQTIIESDANAFVTPQCAMQVSRSGEVTPVAGGGMASYQPPMGCGCYYETLKNGGTPYSANADAGGSGACPSAYPNCNFGYCEVQ
jgi:hypothetical protein